MGWTYTHRGETPIKKFLAERVNCVNEHASWNILAMSIVNVRTAYMAVEIIKRDKATQQFDVSTRQVVAFVFLLDFKKNDHYDTGYKDMDETVGPCERECPEKILDLLTVTTSEYALEWRRKCRENINKKKRLSAILKGSCEFTTEPIQFGDGMERSRFKLILKKPLTFQCLDSGTWCKIPRKLLSEKLILPAGNAA